MLTAHGLTKRFGAATALAGLDLEVTPGEVFCLLGANGAGKTTTINLFLGFLRPDGGTASIGGIDVAADPVGSKALLAYIPEQVALYRHLTGVENLAYFARLAGRRLSRAELLDVLDQAGLARAAAERRVDGYSKGMRQKVGIAIAIAKRAKALLLDEPTSGLDPKSSNEFSRLIGRMSGSGVAILMATHDLFRAKETGGRIGIMRDGTLLRTLAAADVGHGDLERLYLDLMAD